MTSPSDPEEEDFCFRCHSETDDTTPGGGLVKSTGGQDWYSAASMTSSSEGIWDVFQSVYTHNLSTSGVHKPSSTDEDSTYLASNRHVECTDCHNPHVATSANPLKGVWGLLPDYGSQPAGSPPDSYSVVAVTDRDHQYKVCYKCHSDWASAGSGQNVAEAFNPGNDSFHWVMPDLTSYSTNTGTGPGIYANALFNSADTYNGRTYVEIMMSGRATYTDAALRTTSLICSDCHGTDTADGFLVPDGPHGSSIPTILKTPQNSPYTMWGDTQGTDFGTAWCFNCHDPELDGTGFSASGEPNLHDTQGNQSEIHFDGPNFGGGVVADGCQACHVPIPHGAATRQHLLRTETFTNGVDSEDSGNYNQHDGWVIPGCT
jgi:hypothetical protein